MTDSLVDPYSDSELPSTSGPEWFRAAVQSRLPEADIRTSQNPTVRVNWRNVVAGIRRLNSGGYQVSAGDALAQSENIVFEMAVSSHCQTDWDAVHRVVEYCLQIVSQR